MIECGWCRAPFTPGRKANARTTYYSAKCRKRASRAMIVTEPAVNIPIQDDRDIAPAAIAAPVTRPSVSMEEVVHSDWQPCLPSDWATLPDLTIPDFLRREIALQVAA